MKAMLIYFIWTFAPAEKMYEEFVRRAVEEDGVEYVSRTRQSYLREKWQVHCQGSRYITQFDTCRD